MLFLTQLFSASIGRCLHNSIVVAPGCGRNACGVPLNIKCVCKLCLQVRKELGPVDPYFNKLADGMITWIEAWGKLNPNSEP